MTVLAGPTPGTGAARYTLRIAADAAEVAAAQRLRHRVFAGELGATLHTAVPGHDVDEFDEYCDHLIVVKETTGDVVGTYRMLPPGRAPKRYSGGEFDLSALAALDAAGVWDLAVRRHLSPAGYRVLPHRPWAPVERPAGRMTVPPLLRGYLRLGSWICGAPAHDPDFGCADFFVLLGLDRIDPRYLRHFLGSAP